MFNQNTCIMKKVLFLILAILFIGAGIAIAQDPVPPTDPISWVTRFPEMIGSFWGCVVSAILWVPILLGLLNQTEAKKIVKYLITGAVVVILTVLAKALPFGYLHDAKVWFVVLNGVFIGGSQVIGYAALKPFLDAIAEKFNPWKSS